MEALIGFAITAGVSVVLLLVIFIVLKSQAAASFGAERNVMVKKIDEIDKEIQALLSATDGYVAKGQFDTLAGQLDSIKHEVERARTSLKEIEPKLDGAQKLVEEREAFQQEMKTSKEDDEVNLRKVLDNYSQLSTEAYALEQQLASSLKNLDKIMSEITLTDDQRAIFDELSRTLSNTGGQLRDLLIEYESLNERLKTLEEQLLDLEEEYTKLVEKQLGE